MAESGGQGQDRGRVAASGLEDDEAEVGDASHAELLTQAEAGHGVDGGVDEQVDEVVGVHPAAFPSSPAGRTPSMMSSAANAITYL